MDVFYYWKDHREDRKQGRLGRFRSGKDKLNELRAGRPDDIWVFKTPDGQKGRLQLLGRLRWSDTPPVAFTPAPGESHVFYYPDHPESVWFDGSGEESAIEAVTTWVRTHFPKAVSANFQGTSGQHELRGAQRGALKDIARRLAERPFRTAFAST